MPIRTMSTDMTALRAAKNNLRVKMRQQLSAISAGSIVHQCLWEVLHR